MFLMNRLNLSVASLRRAPCQTAAKEIFNELEKDKHALNARWSAVTKYVAENTRP